MSKPSELAMQIRATIIKESVDSSLSAMDALLLERAAWDTGAAEEPLAEGVVVNRLDVGEVSCLIFHPTKNVNKASAVVYVHGGGLVAGSLTTHRAFVSKLAALTQRSFVLVDYRLLPEHPEDSPVIDVMRVCVGLDDQCRDFKRFAMMGDSSGAALMLAVQQALCHQGRLMPACSIALSGAFDATLSGDHLPEADKRDPFLSLESLRQWQQQIAEPSLLKAPMLSPLLHSVAGVSPMLLLCGTDDLWCNDSARMAQLLRDAGVAVNIQTYDAMWHVWPMFGDMPETSRALADIKKHLDQYL